jgi:GNAT superfamily N-acetyltransferase
MPQLSVPQLNAQFRAEQIAKLVNTYSQLTDRIDPGDVLHNTYLSEAEIDKVLGCVKVRKLNWYLMEVCHLVVDLKNRRKGLGTSLVQQAELWGKNAGLKVSQCTIRLQNTPSIRLFHTAGYQPGPIFQGPREMVRLWTKAIV